MNGNKSSDEWRAISGIFESEWNFPHVVGALDGKHIRIEYPKKTGSLYYNFKSFYSFVLLALCDAQYCFTLYDLGQYGSDNDSGIFMNSQMGSLLEKNQMQFPEPENLNG